MYRFRVLPFNFHEEKRSKKVLFFAIGTFLFSMNFIFIATAENALNGRFENVQTVITKKSNSKAEGYNISDLKWNSNENSQSSSFKYYEDCNVNFELNQKYKKIHITASDEKKRIFCQNQFVKYILPEMVSAEISSKVLKNKHEFREIKTKNYYGNLKAKRNSFSFMLFECSNDSTNCPNELLHAQKQIEKGEIDNPNTTFIPVYEKN